MWFRKEKRSESSQMHEAIREGSWNVIALPIPTDASKELLEEIYKGARHFTQVYVDDIRDGYLVEPPIEKPEAQEKLRLARRRLVQAEWRLNIMGYFPSEHFSGFDPVDGNAYVKDVVERMSRPESPHYLPWYRERDCEP